MTTKTISKPDLPIFTGVYCGTSPDQDAPILALGDALNSDATSSARGLVEGDDFCDAGYPGCQFRYPMHAYTRGPVKSAACNITLTGRTVQDGPGNSRWVKCRVEWVGDYEASEFTNGWIRWQTWVRNIIN